MAADAGSGACMIDEKDVTGDGECGKLMWVMGTPIDDWPGWVDMAMDAGMSGTDAWTEGIGEITGLEAGSCGMPP